MLHALLRGKLSREQAENFFSAEDVLTSVVLGSASYLDPKAALLPFLSEARSIADEPISWPLVAEAECEFWPSWSAVDLDGPAAAASEPEVVVRLTDRWGRSFWLLIEVKLHNGISSSATKHGAVNHQLAKYWLHLNERAKQAGATALGVVYVTKDMACPTSDIEDANAELAAKGAPAGAFFWLSWRRFGGAVAAAGSTSPLLRDVLRLLKDEWDLEYVAVNPSWPVPVSRRAPRFFHWGWDWPVPKRTTSNVEWFRDG